MGHYQDFQQLLATKKKEPDNTPQIAKEPDIACQNLTSTASPTVTGRFTHRGVDEVPFNREEYLKNRQTLIENSRTRHHFRNDQLDAVFQGNWRRPPELASIYQKYEKEQILQEHNKKYPPILYMRRLYLLVHGSKKRYVQWVGRAMQTAIYKGAISEVGDTRWLINENPKNINKLHVRYAMILLAYGPNAIYNRDLLRQLSEYTGVPIPPACRVRAEQLFAVKLRKLIEGLGTSICFRSCALEEQVTIENYRVDFMVKILDKEVVTTQFILEFDEAYHQTVRQQRKDKQRDAHLQQLGYKIIRVKESEADNWLKITRLLDYPLHEPTIRKECIESATCIHPRTKQRYISMDSINNWDAFDKAVTANLIKDSTQKLAQFAKLLDAAGQPYTHCKMLLNGKEQRVLRLLCE
ncbi:DUF559 domain-containing protein [Shewanella xiamenensis]|uniref:DUF559 domain-containing protein n=1 Tax=Shewanella xiamenensis TaxID=332186 RepID=UPI0035BA6888